MSINAREIRELAPLKRADFSIGFEFMCGGNRWRCTDVGTRTVIAILPG